MSTQCNYRTCLFLDCGGKLQLLETPMQNNIETPCRNTLSHQDSTAYTAILTSILDLPSVKVFDKIQTTKSSPCTVLSDQVLILCNMNLENWGDFTVFCRY